MNTNENAMTNDTMNALLADLNGRNVRLFLQPLTKALGGLPATVVKAYGCAAGHYTNMPRTTLVDAIVHVYGEAKIRQTMEAMAAATPTATLDDLSVLRDAIQRIASGATSAAATVDEEQVAGIVKAALDAERPSMLQQAIEAARASLTVTFRVEQANMPTIDCGVQHFRFPTLVKMLGARLGNGRRINVWLHGPASTGKTTAAAAAAKALGLKFGFSGSIETAYALMGYTDAHGRTIRTPFREVWEHGGVFLMDEADGSSPQALCALNAAIDGSLAAFPDGMIPRHADCVIVAGANTVGRGGSAKFAGRVKQDEAFMARWAMLEWAHDDRLESALVGSDEIGQEWLKVVRAFRKAAKDEMIDGASTTTRASLDGAALLRAGLDRDTVLEACIRKGMPQDSWDRLFSAVKLR